MARPRVFGNTAIKGNLTVDGNVTATGTNVSTIAGIDSTFTVQDNGDSAKKMRFECSGITTANTRVLTVPDADITIAGIAATQTLTNKTITAPVLSGSVTGTYTLAGTPTITAPAISAPVLSGSATGTYTLAGTPTITAPAVSAPVLSGTATGTYTLAGTPTITAPTITSMVATVADDAALTFGTTAPSTIVPNSTRKVLEVGKLGVGVDIQSELVQDRFKLVEYFSKKPQLTGVTQLPSGDTYNTASFLANQVANHYFEVLGTNAISTDVTAYAEGGIAVATHGAANDSTIILPHLTSGQSPWTTTTWGSDQSTRWECCIETPAAVTSCVIWAGLKLTNTPTLTTDNDQVYFVLDTTAGANPTHWHCVDSIANTDTDTSPTEAVVAATKYHLLIDINSSRVAKFYINGTLYRTTSALTTATDFKPYIGIKDLSAGSARTLYVYSEAISRKPGVA